MSNELWDAIGKLKFVYNEQSVSIDPRGMLIIDEEALSEAFANQGASFGSLGFIAARLDAAAKDAKRNVILAEARAHRTARDTMPGKPTVATLEAEVALDPRVQDAHQKLIQAEEILASIKGMMAAMRMRADMLTMLGARQRAELELTGRQTPDYDQIMRNAQTQKET